MVVVVVEKDDGLVGCGSCVVVEKDEDDVEGGRGHVSGHSSFGIRG